MLNRGDLIELDDNNKYFVADIFMDLGNIYVTLVNEADFTKLKFATLVNDTVVEIQNPNTLEHVIRKANDNLNKKNLLDNF